MVKIYKPVNDNDFLDQISFVIFVAGFRFSVVDSKWPQIKKAFKNFSVDKVDSFKEKDVEKTMKAEGMIKNQGKIEAIVKNAQLCKDLAKEHGSVLKWVQKLKRENKKDPLFNPNLEESLQRFHKIGKQTSSWIANLHNAPGKYIEYTN